jgi:hypothetical protein
MAASAQQILHVRLRTPDLTEELVRFLRRMGYPAREVDYGLVAVESDGAGRAHLCDYLRIWQRVNARGAVELVPAPAR